MGLVAIGLTACSSIDVDASLQEGQEALEQGDLGAAEDAFLAVLDEEPDNAVALFDMGILEQGRDRADLAEGYYRSAIESDPSYVSAMYNLAILRAEAGDPVEAMDLYRKVIFLEPTHAEGHLNLGLLLLEAGYFDEAAEQLDHAIALDPSLSSRLPAGLSPSSAPS